MPKVDVLWNESEEEPEAVAKRPRISEGTDLSSFWLDVTFTKQLTQKNKRFSDGRVQMYPRTLTAKLFDSEGTFVSSGNFQTVIGFSERWNKAVTDDTDITVTKGFYGHLVFVAEPLRKLPLSHKQYACVWFN